MAAAVGARVGFLSHLPGLCARLLTAPGASEPATIRAIADAYIELLTGPGAELSAGELHALLESGKYFELAEGSSARDPLRDGLRELENIARAAVRDHEAFEAEIRARLVAHLDDVDRAEARQTEARRQATVETFETSTGKIFTRVRHPKFGLAWRDPDGDVWSKPNLGKFKNKGRDENGFIVDSDAAKACSEIGGRLPTIKDLERLGSYFDHDSGEMFTDAARSEFYHLFPGARYRSFWSSSISGIGRGIMAEYFDGDHGCLGSGMRGDDNYAVLCIAGP